MLDEAVLQIKKIRDAAQLSEIKEITLEVIRPFGYDRILFFSVSPFKILWAHGYWFTEEIDENQFTQKCPIINQVSHVDTPFYWMKLGAHSAEGDYQLVDKPMKGVLSGIQLPVFGRSGLVSSLSLGGTQIDSSIEVEYILGILANQISLYSRKLLALSTENNIQGLTRREKEIINLLSNGLKQRQVSEILGISERTIENHVRKVRQKLGTTTTAEAIKIILGF